MENREITQFINNADASLQALLRPRSIAVIGASEREGSIGSALTRNLLESGFRGDIALINPKAETIYGKESFATLREVPYELDLAVIVIPAAYVEQSVQECADVGIKALVIISAGFAEVAGGRATEQRIMSIVRAHGMRMVGPNCMGILNTDEQSPFNVTFAPTKPPTGNIGFLSQSGALGIAVLDYVKDHHIGISSFLSVGNKADVSGNDVAAFWLQDPATKVIALYLESFGNPRRFAKIAPIVSEEKPIVAVKSGRSSAGARAASSHSASLSSPDIAVTALFEKTGVIRTDSLEELFDVVTLLSSQPLVAGNRVGIVTNAGGPAILLADALEWNGLNVAELSPQTMETLRAFLPPQASVQNPVDMIASATPDQYRRAIAAVGADANVDALIAIYVPPVVSKPEEVAQAIADAARNVPKATPVLTVFLSSAGSPEELHSGSRGHIPCYGFPENAARALGAAFRYKQWKKRAKGTPREFTGGDADRIRSIFADAYRDRTADGWLPPHGVRNVLLSAALPLVKELEASVGDAVSAARNLTFPLVAKAISSTVVHKSDIGGVILNIRDSHSLDEAVKLLQGRFDQRNLELDGILLQEYIGTGLETIVGATVDPKFGPLVMCGMGGVHVELLRDVSFCLTPVTDEDAKRMINGLRSKKLFEGYRGSAPSDVRGLCHVIEKLSALLELIPEITEVDLNPVRVLRPGEGVVVLDARIRVKNE